MTGTTDSAGVIQDGWLRRYGLTALTFALLVGAAYFPALRGGFVWDDAIFTEEPALHAGSGLWSIWFSPSDIRNEGHYWPVVYTSFWLEHLLWGLAPAGYHAVNLVLHWINSLLVWRLLSRLAVPGAWAAAAVFAVHPLHVESVAWIIERKDLLSALFYLAAALTWIRYVETPGRGRYALALALFTAGLLSKSIVVTLPAALLIWHWWQRERITSTDLLRLAPFFAVGLAVTLGDLWYYTSREPLALGYSLVERVLIASRALWFYVGKLLWPTDLAIIYPLWDIRAGDPVAWAYAAAVAAAAAILWLGRHRLGRGPLAGALFFAVTLSPVLGLVDYGYMQFSFVADRFQYLAGIGVMAVLVGSAAWGVRFLPEGWAIGARGLLAAVLIGFGVLTWKQAAIYKDGVTFFTHIVSLNPNARDAYANLGSAFFDAGKFDEGLKASRLALKQGPDSAVAHSNIGRALLRQERFDEAGRHLRRALKLQPGNAAARQNLGELLRRQGRREEAVEAYRAVLRTTPHDPKAYAGMATALFRMKRHEEAVAAAQKALSRKSDEATVGAMHLLAGRASQALGNLGPADRHFRRAAETNPRSSAPLVARANLRLGQQRFEEAYALVRRARELSPREPAVLHTQAEVLRKLGRRRQALETYDAALEINPEFAPAHAGRGIALFRSGRHAEAITAMDRALRLQPDLPVASVLQMFMGRALDTLGRPEEAAERYERAVEIDAGNTEALDRLAMTRFGQKRYQEALKLYRKLAAPATAGPQVHANLGATLYHLGRHAEALRSFEKALSLDPELERARTGAAHMRRLLAQNEAAGPHRSGSSASTRP